MSRNPENPDFPVSKVKDAGVEIADAVNIPIIGIGGIANAEDVFDFLVAGASAVQIGTANFYTPDVTVRIIEEMPKIMAQEGINDLSEIIGTLPKI